MGKSSAPPPPDYTAAAKATAAGDLTAARSATVANRPNQITPYGTSTWAQGQAQRTFNQDRYDQALKAAQSGVGAGSSGGFLMPSGEDAAGGPRLFSQPGPMPDRNSDQFYDMTPSDNWTQTVTLAPQAQETLDKQMGLSNEYADLAKTGLEKARGVLSDPTLDMSGIPARAMNVGQTGQDAIMARLNPQFQQREEALRTRLANQGITDTGSEAYKSDFRNFNEGRNDAEMQAALYGIGLDQQNRSSALSEQAYMQDRPLNLVNALRTGAQVQNPSFSAVPPQATTKGPDLLNAANGQFQADLGATNANNASSAGTTSGIMSGLGMAAMMF